MSSTWVKKNHPSDGNEQYHPRDEISRDGRNKSYRLKIFPRKFENRMVILPIFSSHLGVFLDCGKRMREGAGVGREVCRHPGTGHKDWARSINGKILTWLSSHLFETKHSQAAAKLPSILLRSEFGVVWTRLEFPLAGSGQQEIFLFFNETCGL